MKLAIVDDNKLEQELIFNTLRTYEHERNISIDLYGYCYESIDGEQWEHHLANRAVHLANRAVHLDGRHNGCV